MAAVSRSTQEYPLLFHLPPQPVINAAFSSEISKVHYADKEAFRQKAECKATSMIPI